MAKPLVPNLNKKILIRFALLSVQADLFKNHFGFISCSY